MMRPVRTTFEFHVIEMFQNFEISVKIGYQKQFIVDGEFVVGRKVGSFHADVKAILQIWHSVQAGECRNDSFRATNKIFERHGHLKVGASGETGSLFRVDEE